MALKKNELETYISQGRAMKNLLVRTNIHGKHDRKIKRISNKISRAQKSLAKIK
ncbi:MAG TPA: hypothetical protein GX691_03325 [Clostridia bacterium]|nr:hypothetical protein [Clostridia bacterium]